MEPLASEYRLQILVQAQSPFILDDPGLVGTTVQIDLTRHAPPHPRLGTYILSDRLERLARPSGNCSLVEFEQPGCLDSIACNTDKPVLFACRGQIYCDRGTTLSPLFQRYRALFLLPWTGRNSVTRLLRFGDLRKALTISLLTTNRW